MNGAAASYDFISLGAGIGGLTAAITAHDLGLSVIVLEKSDQLGGTTAYSSGQTWSPEAYCADGSEVEDSWEAGFEYLTWLADGTENPELLERLCRTAPEVFAYMGRDGGVRWLPLDLPDNYWPEAPGSIERGRFVELEPFDGKLLPEDYRHIVRSSPNNLYSNAEIFFEMGGLPHRRFFDPELGAQRQAEDIRYQGSALAAYLVMAVLERGIPLLTDVEVTRILAEDGRATGVIAHVAGDERHFGAARGILVAMGGYDWNPELILRYDKRDDVASRAPRSVTGDHFALLEPLQPEIMMLGRAPALGFLEPAELTGDTADRWMQFYGGWPHAIIVNRAGKRFGDEARASSRKDGFQNTMAAAFDVDENGEQINLPCFGIFDSQYREKYVLGRVGPESALSAAFVSAPTVAELAGELGIDPEGLEETIERFNGYARAGEDPELGRGYNRWSHFQFGDPFWGPNPNLGPLEQPPFYAVRLELVGVATTQAGIRTDTEARVVDVHGDPIQGLYATGNTMAWQDMGTNYHSGTANMRGMVWAYIAARHAAGAADATAQPGTSTSARAG